MARIKNSGSKLILAAALPEFKHYLQYLFRYDYFKDFPMVLKAATRKFNFTEIHELIEPVFRQVLEMEDPGWAEETEDPYLLVIIGLH